MTIDQMIEMLTDIKDSRDGDGSGKVHIAEQPSYPFENAVAGVTTREDLFEGRDEDEVEDMKREYWDKDDVIICSGRQLGYTTKDLWDVCRK